MRRQYIAVLTAMLLAGCALREPPKPPPAAGMPSNPRLAVERITASMSARRAALQGFRSLAQLTYRTAENAQRAKHVIVAQRPDRLRFEVLSLLGSVFVLTARDGQLTAYVPRESTVYRGAASRANFARYTRVDLSVHSAIDLLLGTPPLSRDGATSVALDQGLLRFTQDNGGRTQLAWFDGDLTLVRYESRAADGHVTVRASFAAYERIGGIPIATRLHLELPDAAEQIEIALREPEVNPVLPDTLFTLAAPRGSREVDIDRLY